MYDLDQTYIDRLEQIAGSIQESEHLQSYLENEEEEDYTKLKETYEPYIVQVHEQVAGDAPLQLFQLESLLLDPLFEGLFLPKILGYSVLRGEIDESYKYVRPQDFFKEVLLTICQSSNFEILKKRIGQSIQVGFALSSDIWITNLINSVDNKKVRYFLQSQKIEKYRRDQDRKLLYLRYKKQFTNDNYMTTRFPTNLSELAVFFNTLKQFLIFRINHSHLFDNHSLIEPIREFIHRSEFYGTSEHLQILALYILFFDMQAEEQKELGNLLEKLRQDDPQFDEKFLEFLLELHESTDSLSLSAVTDKRISNLINLDDSKPLNEHFKLMSLIHTKGYIHPEVHLAAKDYCDKHEGLSVNNACLRSTIFSYFRQFISNLEENAYTDFFEITKHFPVYMDIFANQKFNQGLEEASMNYVDRLLKTYTDKRGKDYQDIKKFVSTIFQDYGFLTDKEVVELFKTRRKKTEAG